MSASGWVCRAASSWQGETHAAATPNLKSCWLVLAAICLQLAGSSAAAQDLEPRAYSAKPIGVVFALVNVARSHGSVLFDPTLRITNVSATLNSVVVGAGYSFDLFGKTAFVSGAVPYGWGTARGDVAEQTRSVDRAGLADSVVRLSANLRGNPAMGAKQFAAAPRKTIIGASITVTSPTGAYDSSHLINLGTNRWGARPEVGLSVPKGRWDFDGYFGVWMYSTNTNFYPGGRSRTQENVQAAQLHVDYTFRPGLWLAFDSNWYAGGSTSVDGASPSTGVKNSRVGVTFSMPLSRQQTLNVAYSSGAVVRAGSDLETIAVTWQVRRLTK
jgi:hypothetical protein